MSTIIGEICVIPYFYGQLHHHNLIIWHHIHFSHSPPSSIEDELATSLTNIVTNISFCYSIFRTFNKSTSIFIPALHWAIVDISICHWHQIFECDNESIIWMLLNSVNKSSFFLRVGLASKTQIILHIITECNIHPLVDIIFVGSI